MESLPLEFVVYALVGGAIPAMIWLLFWVFEDRYCPEPKRIILGAFVFGALAALITIPFQAGIAGVWGASSLGSMLLFVAVEEYVKYTCCWYAALRDPHNNERIDPVIFLACGALGFAALENTLYLLNYMSSYSLDIAALEGGKRIIGATVLHTVTSAIVGLSLAIAFRWKKVYKHVMAGIGLSIAILVHLLFNVMVSRSEHPDALLLAFSGCWVLLFVVILCIEFQRGRVCPTVNYDRRPM